MISVVNAEEVCAKFEAMSLEPLMHDARRKRAESTGPVVSYSRKVFIPLTQLCRDTCGYCTFAKSPRALPNAFLSPDDVLSIARAGERAGCHEALFTLGDKPELRYQSARDALAALGFATTVDYLEAMCALVLRKTSLLPHVNAGVMTEAEIVRLRAVSVSQGIMLESISPRLCERGQAHFGSPDKDPALRMEMIFAAGRQRVPFTSGILIGIGETRLERVQSLLALKDAHERHGHIQEIIVQNFRAKADTRFALRENPHSADVLWTAAVARLLLPSDVAIQVPPNLSFDDYPALLQAGINDWGGVSPVTIDHVNPEAPWPDLARLETATRDGGFSLLQRLPIYPSYVAKAESWVDPSLLSKVLSRVDSDGFVRIDRWKPGALQPPPNAGTRGAPRSINVESFVARASSGTRLSELEVLQLFRARGGDVDVIVAAADELRSRVNGDVVRYVVNRNINYTNVCTFKCTFCAFSKGNSSTALRGKPYDLTLDEVARRAREAWSRGATEVCMQGGINPRYTGETYLDLLRTVKAETPGMHIHAFSPLEVSQGAATLGISVERFLQKLRDAGLGSLPGTAAEILDDDVRRVICPDKLTSREWLDVVATAHKVGLRTTATIMFGHVEKPVSWARHLLQVRDLQASTGGFTEFVPLPFVHMEAPMSLRGRSRTGPTWREVLLMHAVARLVLHPHIKNIQASWVKLGQDGVAKLLHAGVNDLGGTLMNESISRAAGTEHGQEMCPERMEALIARSERRPEQRTTFYRGVPVERIEASFGAPALTDLVLTPFSTRRVATAPTP